MELCAYITKIGNAKAADLFNKATQTVAAWRRLERVPRPETAAYIVQKTDGVVDWKGIYSPYARHLAKKKCA